MPTRTRVRTRACVTALAAAALTAAFAGTATAADVTAERTITDGGTTYHLKLTGPDSAAAGGANVTVSGTGYNSGQGVYVGLCAVSGAPGANKPTPCLGGQDQSGTTGASHWVSNAGGGTVPNSSRFGAGGSFSVKIHVKADLGNGKVCGETVECAIVTRADHFDSGDRKYDVHIPVTFQ
ncbi:hypothetical protein ABT039_41465 [Streptomyces lasiicapitis]|uniref:LPXTG cell wall anchor domain-containing protein n=1 Tax=Streptomyces lasiicapitis TaxID=1923961 RepID=A0ABQ2LLD0_9ACTN|nr:hypothetical protein [Streptomyces lasiicapitis]GGO39408.1 hypothetical protein GCM10012286_15950 [Streptomyces lasiicapitis]